MDVVVVKAAAEPSVGILDKVVAFVAKAKELAAGGLTIGEFSELAVALVHLVADELDAVAGMSGADKKAAVLEAVGMLFDAVADKAIPAYAYPLWVVVKPAVRSIVLAVAGGVLEQVLVLVRAKA
jgi:hypothetical protein